MGKTCKVKYYSYLLPGARVRRGVGDEERRQRQRTYLQGGLRGRPVAELCLPRLRPRPAHRSHRHRQLCADCRRAWIHLPRRWMLVARRSCRGPLSRVHRHRRERWLEELFLPHRSRAQLLERPRQCQLLRRTVCLGVPLRPEAAGRSVSVGLPSAAHDPSRLEDHRHELCGADQLLEEEGMRGRLGGVSSGRAAADGGMYGVSRVRQLRGRVGRRQRGAFFVSAMRRNGPRRRRGRDVCRCHRRLRGRACPRRKRDHEVHGPLRTHRGSRLPDLPLGEGPRLGLPHTQLALVQRGTVSRLL